MNWTCSLCHKEVPLLSQDYMLLAYPISLDELQVYMSPLETPVYVCKACLLAEIADVDPHVFTVLRRLGFIYGSIDGKRLSPCR